VPLAFYKWKMELDMIIVDLAGWIVNFLTLGIALMIWVVSIAMAALMINMVIKRIK